MYFGNFDHEIKLIDISYSIVAAVVVVVVVAFELEPFPLFSVVARFVVCAVVTVREIIINDTFTALLLLADHTNLLFAYKDLKSQ